MTRVALHPEERYIEVCAGGGGLGVGVHRARPGARCVCYVEVEAPAAAGLVASIQAGVLDDAPVWSDAFTFDGRRFRGHVAGVVGGTPCPEFSVANPKRKASAAERLATPRGSLFFRLFEIADECGARWVFWENVGGAASALPLAFEWLEARGWRGAYISLRASDVGAPHERLRWFLLAHRDGARREEVAGRRLPAGGLAARCDAGTVAHGHGHGCEGERSGRLLDGQRQALRNDADRRGSALPDVAGGCAVGDGDGEGLEERRALRGNGGKECTPAQRAGLGGLPPWPPGPADEDGWRRVLAVAPWLAPALPQPGIRRVADGMALASGGLDRIELLRMLGNGVVPDQAAEALCFLWPAVFGT